MGSAVQIRGGFKGFRGGRALFKNLPPRILQKGLGKSFLNFYAKLNPYLFFPFTPFSLNAPPVVENGLTILLNFPPRRGFWRRFWGSPV